MLDLALLALASFVAALASSSLSIGGGYILFGAATLLYPLPAAIALQPVLSYSSLVSRSVAFRDAIAWDIVRPFSAGSLAGVALGLVVYRMMPERGLALAVGTAMLVLACVRPVIAAHHTRKAYVAVGSLHALSGTVLGLGSVLQPVLLNAGIDRRTLVGTFATCLLALEGIRTLGYAASGFSYRPYALPIAVAVATGIAGTWAGRALIGRLPESWFRWILRIMISLLALRLVALGLGLHN